MDMSPPKDSAAFNVDVRLRDTIIEWDNQKVNDHNLSKMLALRIERESTLNPFQSTENAHIKFYLVSKQHMI